MDAFDEGRQATGVTEGEEKDERVDLLSRPVTRTKPRHEQLN